MDLMEKFVFSSINDKKSRWYVGRTYIRYCLSGIALIQLSRQNKIQIEDKKVSVRDTSSTGNQILDEVLALLAKKTSPIKLNSLISPISYKVKKMDGRVLERLEDNGYLKIEQERFLGIIPYEHYVITHVIERSKLISDLKDIILHDHKTPDADSIALISMANSCGILRKYFSGDERKRVKQRLKLISKGKYFETRDEALYSVALAVKKAIQASQAVAASAGS